MLLKSADSKDNQIAEIEARSKAATGTQRARLERDVRNIRAGIKTEGDVAYLINFDYQKSQNWVVIHDLRLEIGGRVAQIDHLLINRFLHVYVLETKSFHSGFKIDEHGEFLRWNNFDKKYEGMASPLEQNERHVSVLREAFKTIKLPTKLGVTLAPIFHSYVLVSPNARIDRPKSFDTSKVIKADALKTTIDKHYDGMGVAGAFGNLARVIGEGVLYAIGQRLVAQHKPLHPVPEAGESVAFGGGYANPAVAPLATMSSPQASAPETVIEQLGGQRTLPNTSPLRGSGPLSQAATIAPELAPSCKNCGKGIGSILHGQYGYYFKCSGCAGNTSMKWDCGNSGHTPRVRKEGRNFYRECQGCDTSTLFHTNPES
ncbi:MAG TPA: nuclease-related domain-containing protein [Pantanalinema sp.]